MVPLIFWSRIELVIRENSNISSSNNLHRSENFKNHMADCIAALTFGELLKVPNFKKVCIHSKIIFGNYFTFYRQMISQKAILFFEESYLL